MQANNLTIPLEQVVFSLSEALDCINQQVVLHQLKVGYIARLLGRKLGFKGKTLESLVIAGTFHDIGLFTVKEKIQALEEELQDPTKHAILGAKILKKFPHFKRAADFVSYHHTSWEILKDLEDYETALGGSILALADYLERKTRFLSPILLYSSCILQNIKEKKDFYAPEVIEAFFELAEKDLFWLRLAHFKKETELYSQLDISTQITQDEFEILASLFADVIDLRSPFTFVHSIGVAKVAEWLGEAISFSKKEIELLKIAGNLHDLGKLSVPESILNKPGKPNNKEWAILRIHPFLTYRILENIPGLEIVTIWASYHHERLDGKGYPARLKAEDITLGSRIVAVADITTALLENRPYRKSLSLKETEKILKELSGKALDPKITSIVINNLNYVKHIIEEARLKRKERYSFILKDHSLIFQAL